MRRNRRTQRRQKSLSLMAFGFVGFHSWCSCVLPNDSSLSNLHMRSSCVHNVTQTRSYITHYSISGMRLTIWNYLLSALPSLSAVLNAAICRTITNTVGCRNLPTFRRNVLTPHVKWTPLRETHILQYTKCLSHCLSRFDLPSRCTPC